MSPLLPFRTMEGGEFSKYGGSEEFELVRVLNFRLKYDLLLFGDKRVENFRLKLGASTWAEVAPGTGLQLLADCEKRTGHFAPFQKRKTCGPSNCLPGCRQAPLSNRSLCRSPPRPESRGCPQCSSRCYPDKLNHGQIILYVETAHNCLFKPSPSLSFFWDS